VASVLSADLPVRLTHNTSLALRGRALLSVLKLNTTSGSDLDATQPSPNSHQPLVEQAKAHAPALHAMPDVKNVL
jgi:hypothetical protein